MTTCPVCKAPTPPFARNCPQCDADVGYPNVRAAEDPSEVSALDVRLAAAQVSEAARGTRAILDDFGLAVANSKLIIARDIGFLDSLTKSENSLYLTFHQQVRAGARIPSENSWDMGREAADSTVNPYYFEKIHFAAISLNNIGVNSWGKYSITLKESLTRLRTTVFEENPFIFCQKHRLVAGQRPPFGYRATWNNRDKLAMAKLHSRLELETVPADYPGILIQQGTSTADADFIEAHIYGPIHRSTIERVVGPKPPRGPDLVLWKSVTKALRSLGVHVEET